MSNTDIDYIEQELKKTTLPGNKVAWPPPASATHWHNAYMRIEELRDHTTPSVLMAAFTVKEA